MTAVAQWQNTTVIAPLPIAAETVSDTVTDDTSLHPPPPTPDTNGAPNTSPLMRVLRLDDRGDSRVAMISDWVGRGIIEGRLAPGDDLNSVELARHFNTSRTPVREALMLLEKEGLVEIPARRRPRVAHTTLTQVREIYTVRATLLALVAERVAASINDDQLAQLHLLVNTMSAAAADRDLDRYFWANVALHSRTTEIGENQTLKRILDSLGLRVLQLRHYSMSLPQRLDQSIEDHHRLLRAFAEHDVSLASALNRSIVLGALAALERGWSDDRGDR